MGSVLLVADVSGLGGIEEQVADGSHQRVNAERDVGEEEVSHRSGGVAFGLQRSVVDDDTTDKAEEERQQKTNQLVVIHDKSPL